MKVGRSSWEDVPSSVYCVDGAMNFKLSTNDSTGVKRTSGPYSGNEADTVMLVCTGFLEDPSADFDVGSFEQLSCAFLINIHFFSVKQTYKNYMKIVTFVAGKSKFAVCCCNDSSLNFPVSDSAGVYHFVEAAKCTWVDFSRICLVSFVDFCFPEYCTFVNWRIWLLLCRYKLYFP